MPRYFSSAATSNSKRRQNSKTKEIVVRVAKSLKLLVRVFLVHCLGDISPLPSRKLTPWWSLWTKPIYKIIISCHGKHQYVSDRFVGIHNVTLHFAEVSGYRSMKLSPVAMLSTQLLSDGKEIDIKGPVWLTVPLPYHSHFRVSDSLPAWTFDMATGW